MPSLTPEIKRSVPISIEIISGRTKDTQREGKRKPLTPARHVDFKYGFFRSRNREVLRPRCNRQETVASPRSPGLHFLSFECIQCRLLYEGHGNDRGVSILGQRVSEDYQRREGTSLAMMLRGVNGFAIHDLIKRDTATYRCCHFVGIRLPTLRPPATAI